MYKNDKTPFYFLEVIHISILRFQKAEQTKKEQGFEACNVEEMLKQGP